MANDLLDYIDDEHEKEVTLSRACSFETKIDLDELQMRREVEVMIMDYGTSYAFINGKYSLGGLPWCTLPELHTKLKELTDET